MRTRRCIYLGVSPFHSSTVHLVLNPATRSITPQYHLVFNDTFSTAFFDDQFDHSTWTNLLSHGHELHATVQPDLTGSITIHPDCVHFNAISRPLSLPEGAAMDEFVQLPTIQPPNSSDTLDFDLPVPDTPLSLDPANHLDSPSTLSPTERAPVTDHPPLSPTERVSSPTPALRRSQRSTAGLPPDRLSCLAYDVNHHIGLPCQDPPKLSPTPILAKSFQKCQGRNFKTPILPTYNGHLS